ncbi:MAG: hypothetical protein IT177_20910 [Acidobacteria bacterium]|nr:hypothetical protein [Acidobacteriota bacterium]
MDAGRGWRRADVVRAAGVGDAGGPVIASLPVSGTSISVPGVPSGAYYVRGAAVNSVGTGAPSSPVTVVVP